MNALSSRRFRAAAALAGIALASACSLADFAYDLAPRLATRYVDEQLQLTNRQEARALELFRERHAWHARDELPRYHAFLVGVRASLADGASAQDIDAVFDGVEDLFELGVLRTLPAVAEILAGLDADQVDALEERLQERAARYREERDDDHRGRRLDETLEDLEEWLGTVSDEQRKLVRDGVAGMRDNGALWLEWRAQRNAALIELLRSEPGASAIEEFLAGYWLRREGVSGELEGGMAENRRRYRELLVRLDATLSAEQRRHALDRVDEYTAMVLDMMPDDIRLATVDDGSRTRE